MGKQIVKLFNKSNKTYKMKFLFVFCVIAIAVTQTFGCCIQQPAIVGPSTSACNPVSIQPIGGCSYVPQQQYGCYRRTVRKRTTCYKRPSCKSRNYGGCAGTRNGCAAPVNYC